MSRAPRSAGGVPYRGDARFRPSRDRMVGTRTVPCPACGAEADADCITGEGKPTRNYHDSRRRMAVRKSNQERGIS